MRSLYFNVTGHPNMRFGKSSTESPKLSSASNSTCQIPRVCVDDVGRGSSLTLKTQNALHCDIRLYVSKASESSIGLHFRQPCVSSSILRQCINFLGTESLVWTSKPWKAWTLQRRLPKLIVVAFSVVVSWSLYHLLLSCFLVDAARRIC